MIKSLFVTVVLSTFLLVNSEAAENHQYQPAINTALADKSLLLNLIETSKGKLAFGEHGLIVEIDSEHKWQQHSVPVNKTLTASSSFSNGTLLAVGHEGIILRKTLGADWQVVFSGSELLALKKQVFEQNIASLKQDIATENDEDFIDDLTYQLEDVEFALSDLAAEFLVGATNPLLAIETIDDKRALALGAYGTLLLTENMGDSWTLVDGILENSERFHLNSLVRSSVGKLFIFGEAGIGFRSQDSGVTWHKLGLPYEGSLFGSEISSDGQFVIAYGLKGNILISVDGGERWRHVKTISGASLLGSDLDQHGNVWLVGHAGSVVKVNKNDLSLTDFKHPSGDTFADVVIEHNNIIMVGQNGVVHWPIQP